MSNQLSKYTVAALLAASALPALAAPGNGIRLGGSEGRLHPYVELEARYDSNVYAGNTATGVGPTSDYIIHVRPGLTLTVPGEMTEVDLSANLDWAQYLGKTAADGFSTADLSNMYASADLGISVNKKGTVGFELSDSFRRSDRPQSLSFGAAAITNYNALALAMPFRPGGGAMTFSVNGGWAVESYEQPLSADCASSSAPGCDISALGYSDLSGGASVAWKFLPRTSALLDVSYTKHIPNDTAAAKLRSGEPSILRIPVGLSGLITPHLSATVRAGYGTTGGDTGVFDSLGTFLATVEGEWTPTEVSSLKLGYFHDLAVDSGAVYSTNRVSFAARQLVAGRVALGLTASWQLLGYSLAGSETSTIIQAQPSVGVDVTRWLKAELAYAYTDRSSSANAPYHAADHSKNEAWLKVVATY